MNWVLSTGNGVVLNTTGDQSCILGVTLIRAKKFCFLLIKWPWPQLWPVHASIRIFPLNLYIRHVRKRRFILHYVIGHLGDPSAKIPYYFEGCTVKRT